MKPIHYAFLALFASLVALLWAYTTQASLDWVKGKYGEKCYYKGTEHANMRHRIYYSSYQSCLDSLAD
jgi:hypothetical protein